MKSSQSFEEIINRSITENLERIGSRIYDAFRDGYLTFDEVEIALDSLNVTHDLWLGLPDAITDAEGCFPSPQDAKR